MPSSVQFPRRLSEVSLDTWNYNWVHALDPSQNYKVDFWNLPIEFVKSHLSVIVNDLILPGRSKVNIAIREMSSAPLKDVDTLALYSSHWVALERHAVFDDLCEAVFLIVPADAFSWEKINEVYGDASKWTYQSIEGRQDHPEWRHLKSMVSDMLTNRINYPISTTPHLRYVTMNVSRSQSSWTTVWEGK